MCKLLLLIFTMLTVVSAGWSATYYIAPSGSDATGDGSINNRWKTFSKALTSMSSGDTLFVGDGVYTSTHNMVSTSRGVIPPSGTPGNPTTIRAQNKGQVIIDGEWVNQPFIANDLDYVTIDGIVFGRSVGSVFQLQGNISNFTSNIKVLNCGFYDANSSTTQPRCDNFNVRYASSCLVENCFTWGNGKYRFYILDSRQVILRNCLDRLDRCYGDPSGVSNTASYRIYGSSECLVQNCLVVDSDSSDLIRNSDMGLSSPYAIFFGGNPSTGFACNDNSVRSFLSIGNTARFGSFLSGEDGMTFNNAVTNSVFWNSYRGVYQKINAPYLWSNNTCGVLSGPINFHYASEYKVTYSTNCLYYDAAYTAVKNIYSDYNYYYGNTTNYEGTTPGAHDSTTTDFIYSTSNVTGGLKYLPRIESGSNISGVGLGGANIGADALWLIGTPGTIYGETGYNSTTTVPMWPFPNEALIKHYLRQYYFSSDTGTVTGNRGFAKSDTQVDTDKARTLTSYVWEYLGNEMPGDVYQSTSTVSASTNNTVVGATITFNCSLSSGTADVYYWDFGDSSYTVTTTSYTTHCYNSTGTFNVSASADTTAGSANPLITQIDIVQRYTYYISPEGSDSTGDGSYDNPWATLQKGMSSMGGGNILVCKDGTYTGTLNQIDYYNFPSSGSANAWTIIKAEHDNKAIFDGEYVRSMFNCSLIGDNDIKDCRDAYDHPVYWQFEGIIWQNSNVTGGGGPFVQRRRFIKWLRCGNIDAGDGACAAFNVNRCADVLYERCWTMGNGRYQFILYCSSSSIVRQCIARSDRVNPNEIYAIYSMYSAINCEVQNCIAIDSDQHEHYINVDGYSGSFCNPSTDHDGDNINWNSCLALNNNVGGITCSGNNELDACNVTFNNCVLWDINNYWTTNNYIRGQNDVIDHCTFGVFHSTGGQFSFNSYDSSTDTNATMKNTIIYSHTGMLAKAYPGLIYDVEHLDYLSLWLNDTNYSDAPIGTNSITTHNPIWSVTNSSGALKYIVKTELGSYLGSAGESGSAIGGNCLYMVGELGTMYGEPGYNSTTTIPMWPFPNEAFYKYKMRQYYYVDTVGPVSGNRGFCAAAAQVDTDKARTLTSYVWEYLGNTKPATIYNSTSTVTSNVSSVLVGTTVTFNCALSSGTADVYYWDFGDSSYDVTYTPEAAHSYSTDGIYKVSVAADTTAGATDPVYMSMTVGAAIQEGTNAVVGGCSVGNCIWR